MRALVLALFLLPVAANAQIRAGIGVRVGSPPELVVPFNEGFDIVPGAPVTFSLPVDINEVVRVEPLIGYSRRSFDSGDFDQTTSTTTLGVVVSALVPIDGVTLTPGVRVRNTRFTIQEDDRFGSGFDFSINALGIGPLVGGEYRFSQRFRIGAEAGLEYQTVGFDSAQDTTDDTDVSSIQTTAAVSVRFFL